MSDDKNPSAFVPWPKDQPPQYNGSGWPCDMWIGPCSCGATHTATQRLGLTWVEGPPAHPTSLGDVWIGVTRPTFVVSEKNAMAEAIDELQRLRAMERRLLAWADQLDANRDKPGDVGKFIAAELRDRMAADR